MSTRSRGRLSFLSFRRSTLKFRLAVARSFPSSLGSEADRSLLVLDKRDGTVRRCDSPAMAFGDRSIRRAACDSACFSRAHGRKPVLNNLARARATNAYESRARKKLAVDTTNVQCTLISDNFLHAATVTETQLFLVYVLVYAIRILLLSCQFNLSRVNLSLARGAIPGIPDGCARAPFNEAGSLRKLPRQPIAKTGSRIVAGWPSLCSHWAHPHRDRHQKASRGTRHRLPD